MNVINRALNYLFIIPCWTGTAAIINTKPDRTGHGTGRTQKSDWHHYIAFMKAQLTELLTQLWRDCGVWFDGFWDQLAQMIRKRSAFECGLAHD